MGYSPLLSVMVAAVRKAGRALARDFGEVENLQVSVKGPGDFVSAADRRSEKILIEELSRARPGYSILAEESGAFEGSDKSHRWIIDPLDGTTNFLHSFPLFAISLGLERDGQIAAGVIYNPAYDELYTAEKGKGAFLNDRRLRVAARTKFADAMVSCGVPNIGKKSAALSLAEIDAVSRQVSGVRSTGSAALDLAFVAAGRFDAYWEHGLSAWDLAAGMIMIREAGGFVTDMDGGERALEGRGIVAGNEAMHADLLKMLRSVNQTT